jgi:hypothetical protein
MKITQGTIDLTRRQVLGIKTYSRTEKDKTLFIPMKLQNRKGDQNG